MLYEFNPGEKDELAMRPGDVVTVLSMQTREQGWWKGQIGDRVGLFPQA